MQFSGKGEKKKSGHGPQGVPDTKTDALTDRRSLNARCMSRPLKKPQIATANADDSGRAV
jgi:hypothetical protein